MSAKYKDTDDQAFNRIRDSLIDWRDSTINLAAVISEAKERRIWQLKYDSWSEFCQLECGITKQWANKLVLANKTMLQIANSEPRNQLQNKGTTGNDVSTLPPPDLSVAAAAELAKIAPENRSEVLAKASASGTVTAKSVAAASQAPSPREIIELDDTGTRIPGDALPFWKKRNEVQDLLNTISRIKCLVEKAKQEADPMFGKVSNALISDLTSAYTHMLEAKPYAVCTTCMGAFTVQPNGCNFCGNKGLISKFQWDTQAKKEVKEMRLKMSAKKP